MTNHLHQALRLASHVLLLALGLVLLPVALPSTAPVASAMSFNPAAELDTSHIQDLRPEATDVLMLTWDNADPALWNGLLDRTEWYAETDGDVPGEGTFYVPVRTVVHVSDGAYIASYDGWLFCSSTTVSTMTCENVYESA